MKLTEQNLREKEFHNKLQSQSKGRFENIFYKAISNAWEDFYSFLNINARNSEILDYGCGRGGDILKFYHSRVKSYVGYDPYSNGIHSSTDGTISRYNNYRKKMPNRNKRTNKPWMYYWRWSRDSI